MKGLWAALEHHCTGRRQEVACSHIHLHLEAVHDLVVQERCYYRDQDREHIGDDYMEPESFHVAEVVVQGGHIQPSDLLAWVHHRFGEHCQQILDRHPHNNSPIVAPCSN